MHELNSELLRKNTFARIQTLDVDPRVNKNTLNTNMNGVSFAQRLAKIKNYCSLEQIVFQQLSKQEPEPEEKTNFGGSNLDNMQIFKVR